MTGRPSFEPDWFDFAHGFSGDDGAWERLQETYSSLPDLAFEIECGGEMHGAVLTQDGIRVSHSDSELEQALIALGAKPPGCLTIHRAITYLRRADWHKKPDWTVLLKSDLELQMELARPWGPSFGKLRDAREGEEASLLRDLSLLPSAARKRLAVTLVVALSGDSSPLFRQRAAQVCLRILDGFEPDSDYQTALSIVRVMMMEERP